MAGCVTRGSRRPAPRPARSTRYSRRAEFGRVGRLPTIPSPHSFWLASRYARDDKSSLVEFPKARASACPERQLWGECGDSRTCNGRGSAEAAPPPPALLLSWDGRVRRGDLGVCVCPG